MTVREMLQTGDDDYQYAVYDNSGNLLSIVNSLHAYINFSYILDQNILRWKISKDCEDTIDIILNIEQ